jgi:alpha-L-fucosidase
MYVAGSDEFKHHVATYGRQSQFGYKDFFQSFRAEKFDATSWAKLFKEAGVKYVVPVAEHHDGFPMYDSDFTDWTAKKLGAQRDVIAEQAGAYRKQGIKFGASSHRAEHWFFFDNGMYINSDVRDPRFADLYGPAVNKRTSEAQAEPPTREFLDDWLLRSCEIVDKYRPEVFYFDWWICQPVFQPYLRTFAAYYYNRGIEWRKPFAINFKEWEGISFPRGAGVFDMERGAAADIQPAFWQTCTSVSRNSWGYITNHIYKDTGEIVDELVDIVSKNGTMLLNIGPKADGTIPEPEQRMLREIGAWLEINGEAIYGTRPWHKFGEGPTQLIAGSFSDKEKPQFTAADFRFTAKGKSLYVIALAWPQSGKLVVKSLAGQSVKSVKLLGYNGRLKWEDTSEGLFVTLPEESPCSFAVTLKIAGVVRR